MTPTRYKLTKKRDDRISVVLGPELIAYLRTRAENNLSDVSTELRGILLREQRTAYGNNGAPPKRTP